MSDSVQIRKATPADLEVLLEFEQEIVRAERPFDPTIARDPVSYYNLAALVHDSSARVLVATCGDVIVSSGMGRRRAARDYLDHQEYAYLGFMYTQPAFRGRGINRQIIEALVEWAVKEGLKEVRLTVYEDNVTAIKAYEKSGFKKHISEMRLVSQ